MTLPQQSEPTTAPDRRWLYLHRLNELRQLLFGDEPTTTSGLLKGEDNRLAAATILNQLQADLNIASGVEPTRFKCAQCRCPVDCVCCTPERCECSQAELYADDGFGI